MKPPHLLSSFFRKYSVKDKEAVSEQRGRAPGSATYTAPQEVVDMGNKVFRGELQEAIDKGLELLKEAPRDPMVHINLMQAYTKAASQNPYYLDEATKHARLAILYGHHTGLAEYRLAVNLEKKRCYHQSIQLYNLILDNPLFHFSRNGMGRGIDFATRRARAIAKLHKATDSESDVLFTDAELQSILTGIAEADARETSAQEEFRERMRELEDRILHWEE